MADQYGIEAFGRGFGAAIAPYQNAALQEKVAVRATNRRREQIKTDLTTAGVADDQLDKISASIFAGVPLSSADLQYALRAKLIDKTLAEQLANVDGYDPTEITQLINALGAETKLALIGEAFEEGVQELRSIIATNKMNTMIETFPQKEGWVDYDKMTAQQQIEYVTGMSRVLKANDIAPSSQQGQMMTSLWIFGAGGPPPEVDEFEWSTNELNNVFNHSADQLRNPTTPEALRARSFLAEHYKLKTGKEINEFFGIPFINQSTLHVQERHQWDMFLGMAKAKGLGVTDIDQYISNWQTNQWGGVSVDERQSWESLFSRFLDKRTGGINKALVVKGVGAWSNAIQILNETVGLPKDEKSIHNDVLAILIDGQWTPEAEQKLLSQGKDPVYVSMLKIMVEAFSEGTITGNYKAALTEAAKSIKEFKAAYDAKNKITIPPVGLLRK